MKNISILFFLCCFTNCQITPAKQIRGQDNTKELPAAFQAISTSGKTISCANSLEVNKEGGHLQGVQIMRKNAEQYAYLSGSSSTYSYYAILRIDNESEVLSIQKILDKPFKHAGGFQIYKEWMAIGVEDNDAKNQSKIFIYKITDPALPPTLPFAVIERKGAYKRATAGCVGLTKWKEQLLLAVGDWDSKHLDFYAVNLENFSSGKEQFELVYAIDTESLDRKDWADREWLSYQNINLLENDGDQLYLLGTASNSQDEDVADLYELVGRQDNAFQLKKIQTKNFGRSPKTKFRWGAGVEVLEKGRLRIVASGENLSRNTFLSVFD